MLSQRRFLTFLYIVSISISFTSSFSFVTFDLTLSVMTLLAFLITALSFFVSVASFYFVSSLNIP
ncbi:hypothetical protein GCWU000342_00146 [Shuttleworthella satelles DSM 14600]|uniref:Uncharacterized protein n=1 Tax=Shuttleworthella satelles DSM 14600 TaxID=626523 RepID=C4G851_9FIRM|nr:hypothetical protein GCWU000342_00146 [Shuttleworthia satelles DSM 14600]